MPEHYLDPLLSPGSIALVGASDRPDSPGQVLARMVIESDYAGDVYPVNPGYSEILGQTCYPYLESLPVSVDHAIIALGNQHLESALQAAIDHGARAVTIYSSGVLEQDSEPRLMQRLSTMARNAGVLVCGVNGMGFYNVRQDLYAGIFPRAAEIIKGRISYIAQSGSAFTTLCHNGCRLGFNLCVSAGNEIATGVADYMDWSLEQPDTSVIGLFLETVREPQAFVAALEKANDKGIPVVVLKIGKSPLSAAMAVTHTGAIAGNHAAFEALFRRHGVIEVKDFDEMAAILMLLQSGREAADGGFAAVFESGGFRELITDEAHEMGIGFAALEDSTVEALKPHLDAGLKAENPLDAWGSHDRFEERFETCMELMMQDPNVAAGAFISNLRDGYYLSEAIYRVVAAVSRKTAKPIALATCYADLANGEICRRAHEAGIPLIDGARETLLAFRHLFEYHRYRRSRPQGASAIELDPELTTYWRQTIAGHADASLGEVEALRLMQDFDMPVVKNQPVSTRAELLSAANTIGYPLVLKTASPGIAHKSDAGGVHVGIGDRAGVERAYADLASRLGPEVLVMPRVGAGVEVALGLKQDQRFGPLIIVACGGVLIELLGERAFRLAPLERAEAEVMLDETRLRHLLAGVRGRPAADRQALVELLLRFSALVVGLGDVLAEIDLNPVIVGSEGCTIVDALVVAGSA